MKLLGIVGWSGSGKTTLIEKLLPKLIAENLRVSVVKHAHHDFDIDHPGKDSHRLRKAGCREVLIGSSRRWALMHEIGDDETEGDLRSHLARLSPCDMVLVEGFKRAHIPKLEVWRRETKKPPLAGDDKNIIAVAADCEPPGVRAEILPLNNASAVADFLLRQ